MKSGLLPGLRVLHSEVFLYRSDGSVVVDFGDGVWLPLRDAIRFMRIRNPRIPLPRNRSLMRIEQ